MIFTAPTRTKENARESAVPASPIKIKGRRPPAAFLFGQILRRPIQRHIEQLIQNKNLHGGVRCGRRQRQAVRSVAGLEQKGRMSFCFSSLDHSLLTHPPVVHVELSLHSKPASTIQVARAIADWAKKIRPCSGLLTGLGYDAVPLQRISPVCTSTPRTETLR